ncbi:replication factor A protein 3 [Pluteus cervinus]|uniref:Replication factor A protein 3 n=1 Tax=Pluteus cervinus TaxID=181527 RepID=A0ACD3B5C0_9AGAR|nr:replication factor A protein 3 [Pluteus cervinus]
MSTEFISTRVNSARLADYQGQMVRLACRVGKLSDGNATVVAADGGEVSILIGRLPVLEISDHFIEVIGKVENATTIRMLNLVNLGNELDLGLVNDTIEFIHDPKYYNRIFRPPEHEL